MSEDEFESKICQVCGGPIKEGPIVSCKECRTPHHLDCWEYLGHCSTFGCRSTKQTSKQSFQHTNAVVVIDDETIPATGMKRRNKNRGKRRSSRRKKKVTLSEKRKSRLDAALPKSPNGAAGVILDRAEDYSREHHGPIFRVDLLSPLEKSVLGCGFLSLAVAVGIIDQLGFGLPFVIALAITLFWAYSFKELDCTYILDNRSKTVYFFRRIFGLTSSQFICSFNDVKLVATRGFRYKSKTSVHWNYDIAFVLRNGTVIPVTNTYGYYDEAFRNSRILAKLVGAQVKKQGRERELVVSGERSKKGAGPLVRYEHYEPFRNIGFPSAVTCAVIIYFIISVFFRH